MTLIETVARAMADLSDGDWHAWEGDALAAISAIESAGYRIVPVEPTKAMREAAAGASAYYINAAAEWAAMLAAAPKVAP